jgi:hypothetical protein
MRQLSWSEQPLPCLQDIQRKGTVSFTHKVIHHNLGGKHVKLVNCVMVVGWNKKCFPDFSSLALQLPKQRFAKNNFFQLFTFRDA